MLKVFLGFLIIIAVYIIILYIKLYIKRIFLYLKLKTMEKTLKFKILPNHLFWFFGNKCGKNCDFYIETNKHIYSVKLIDALRKRDEYRFLCDDIILKEYSYWIMGARMPAIVKLHTSYKVINLPKVDFRYKYDKISEESICFKKFIPVLLLYPAPMSVSYVPDKYLPVTGIGNKSNYISNMIESLYKSDEFSKKHSFYKFIQNTGDGDYLFNRYYIYGTKGFMRRISHDAV